MKLHESGEYYVDDDGTRYERVTRIIDDLLPSELSGIPDHVLRNAADRGKRVEELCVELLRTGELNVNEGQENADVMDRVNAFARWCEVHKPKYVAHSVLVREGYYAGTIDLIAEIDGLFEHIIDLKCTARADKDRWRLQVGAYAAAYGFSDVCTSVLHLNPSFSNGYVWREYHDAVKFWAAGYRWWLYKTGRE